MSPKYGFGDLPVGKTEEGKTDLNKRGRQSTLDYATIRVSDQDVDHARGVVAASSRDAQDARFLLDNLGLLPCQTDWYKGDEDGDDA